ncbi:MAG: hypothetical protein Q9213_004594, partial [Squamulea squamosa]
MTSHSDPEYLPRFSFETLPSDDAPTSSASSRASVVESVLGRKEGDTLQHGTPSHTAAKSSHSRHQSAADTIETKKENEAVATTDTSNAQDFLHGFKLYAVVLGISIGYFLILLNSTVVVTAIPTITGRFNSANDVGFYINLPLGAITALIILLTRIPEQRVKKQATSLKATILQLDPLGFLLFAPAVIMLLLALNWASSAYSWGSATIIGLLVGSICCFVVFMLWEWRQENSAMVPLYLFKNRIISACYLTGLIQAGAIVETTYFLPIWFQAIRGDTPTTSGVDIMPTVGSQIFLAAVTGFF